MRMTQKRSAGHVSIEQVARQCGVSRMTVTRAFRSDLSVAASTRQKILKTAEKLGYQPRGSMGRPRSAKPAERPTAEVVLGMTVHSAFYSELISSIECALAERKHDCIIRSANGDFEEFVNLCEILHASPDAPTLVAGYLPIRQLRALLEVRPQALLVDHTGDPGLEVPYASISFDNAEAARMMARHLLGIGRKRILLLNGLPGHYFTRDIELGYREALSFAQEDVDEELITEGDFTPESAVERLGKALDNGVLFDAVFANDEMAMAVLQALHRRGIRVPEDVAVAGCDGLPLGRHTIPSLTTILLDHARLGRMAVEHVLNSEEDSANPCRTRLLPKIEIRESTGT
jgi:DNA-binding LacI/PurR family transcriptional regulator